jgi:integrase
LLIESGADLIEVSEHVGHSSPTITAKVYAHRSDDSRRNVADRLGIIVNGG